MDESRLTLDAPEELKKADEKIEELAHSGSKKDGHFPVE